MKIYISVDMEGISGVNSPDYVLRSSHLYQTGQRLMTEDVNAAVRGAFDAGADEVIVADMHAASGNILVEQLDPRALFLAGTPHQPRFPFMDESVNGMFLIGYHAMAGTLHGNLEHTMSSASWFQYVVNGVPFGEVEIDAAIAGECGVPVVMVSGDDKLCEESRKMLGNIESAMVKAWAAKAHCVCRPNTAENACMRAQKGRSSV